MNLLISYIINVLAEITAFVICHVWLDDDDSDNN